VASGCIEDEKVSANMLKERQEHCTVSSSTVMATLVAASAIVNFICCVPHPSEWSESAIAA
jgi:hypothetical protein